MKRLAALAWGVSLLFAQADNTGVRTVSAVRHWSLGDVTRVAVEVSGDFTFHTEQLHNPERVYFDILNSKPRMGQRVMYTESLDDARVKRLRVAQTTPGVTRIVLDLSGPLAVTTSQLANPDRLIIEVRNAPPPTPSAPTETAATAANPTSPSTATATPPPAPLPDAPKAGPISPPKNAPVKPVSSEDLAGDNVTAEPSQMQLSSSPAKAEETAGAPPAGAASKPTPLSQEASALSTSSRSPVSAETAKAARRTVGGDSSLVRELGLKISRVVIDPGHGGHDEGTRGAHGLVEKELVLDVAKRVGKLVEDKMNAEVIYTRSDDTFVPLEGRTALANEKKADLFLSIHANSSPVTRISGTETYYLNFADTKDAIEVASRENAASQASVFELRDLIQKITQHDKAGESREFAARIQSSLYAFSNRNFPGIKNRGVKRAPFVVLIGAQMPSILAEIGFLSNVREEALLKKTDYRQKLAEALFQGLKRYTDGLSHFQVAQTQNQP